MVLEKGQMGVVRLSVGLKRLSEAEGSGVLGSRILRGRMSCDET